MSRPRFSHVSGYTAYMRMIHDDIVKRAAPGSSILDLPAGNGLFGERLRVLGYDVTCADLNEAHPEFVKVNMEEPLPFPSETFDVTVCMEGIEHMLRQRQLLSELVRVTKAGGLIYISTPNVSCLWSRIVLLMCGYFYQFKPSAQLIGDERSTFDKGHISPIDVYTLGYVMAARGAGLVFATADRVKKAVVVCPLAVVLYPFARWSAAHIHRRLHSRFFERKEAHPAYFNLRVFTGRSLIAAFRKTSHDLRGPAIRTDAAPLRCGSIDEPILRTSQ
ncbi:SAM-dependent methyltransferase [Paraburkholderia youngii]